MNTGKKVFDITEGDAYGYPYEQKDASEDEYEDSEEEEEDGDEDEEQVDGISGSSVNKKHDGDEEEEEEEEEEEYVQAPPPEKRKVTFSPGDMEHEEEEEEEEEVFLDKDGKEIVGRLPVNPGDNMQHSIVPVKVQLLQPKKKGRPRKDEQREGGSKIVKRARIRNDNGISAYLDMLLKKKIEDVPVQKGLIASLDMLESALQPDKLDSAQRENKMYDDIKTRAMYIVHEIDKIVPFLEMMRHGIYSVLEPQRMTRESFSQTDAVRPEKETVAKKSEPKRARREDESDLYDRKKTNSEAEKKEVKRSRWRATPSTGTKIELNIIDNPPKRVKPPPPQPPRKVEIEMIEEEEEESLENMYRVPLDFRAYDNDLSVKAAKIETIMRKQKPDTQISSASEALNKLRVCVNCRKVYKEADNFGDFNCFYHPMEYVAFRYDCCSSRAFHSKGCYRCVHIDIETIGNFPSPASNFVFVRKDVVLDYTKGSILLNRVESKPSPRSVSQQIDEEEEEEEEETETIEFDISDINKGKKSMIVPVSYSNPFRMPYIFKGDVYQTWPVNLSRVQEMYDMEQEEGNVSCWPVKELSLSKIPIIPRTESGTDEELRAYERFVASSSRADGEDDMEEEDSDDDDNGNTRTYLLYRRVESKMRSVSFYNLCKYNHSLVN